MFRLVMLTIVAAVLGGYGLSSSTSDTAATSAPGTATSALASTMGMQILPMPETGCGASVISPEKVLLLMQSLPAAQQIALAKVMSASAGVWSAELYTGTLGTGFCLPAQNELVLMPAGSSSTSGSNATTASSVSSTASSLLQSLSGYLPSN